MITEIRVKFAGGPMEKFSYHIIFDKSVFEQFIFKQVTHIWAERNFKRTKKVNYAKQFVFIHD